MTREEAINHIKDIICENNTLKPPNIVVFEQEKEALYTAIKALEQQPCEDAISRQAAIRLAEQGQVQGFEWQLKELIKLSSVTHAEKTGRWIPVSDRLPEEDNEVLITIKSCSKWYICHSVYRDGLFWQKNFEYNPYRNPIAWMPLPQPYNGESEDEE